MGEKLKRILTGVQSTGVPHLGNILGAIIPAIDFSKKENIETFLFIADFHSLTQIKNSRSNNYQKHDKKRCEYTVQQSKRNYTFRFRVHLKNFFQFFF